MTSTTSRTRRAVLAGVAASGLFLAACSTADQDDSATGQATATEQSPSSEASPESSEPTAESGSEADTADSDGTDGGGTQDGEGSNPDGDADQAAAGALSGSYIDYATYAADKAKFHAGDVVLFFNASWCPTCQTANANFQGASFPEGVTVVSVDYDSNQDLRQQFGVTTQHTFVAVDGNGNELSKWTGSNNVDEVLSNL